MKISFAKYHGAGNDFILIDDRALSFPIEKPDLIAALCQRCFGIGADGLILLQPSSKADYRMRIFNQDGSEAAMCGNGIRCLVDFAQPLAPACTVETGHGVLNCQIKDGQIGVHLGAPLALNSHSLSLEGQNWDIHVLNTGVPHGVIFVDDVHIIDVMRLAPQIRFHPLFFPEGINVNFASVSREGTIAVRSYERGVEGETLSCGTGSAAVGWMAAKLFDLPAPIQIHNRDKTHSLEVHIDKGLELWGTATKVFEGNVHC